jgi:hypothetical protein
VPQYGRLLLEPLPYFVSVSVMFEEIVVVGRERREEKRRE